jgi:membrane protein YdbS with pleckstrin-like domain
MTENTKEQIQEENLPKAQSVKKITKRISLLWWLVIVVGILNVVFMQTAYSLIFSAVFVLLCAGYGVSSIIKAKRNRSNK